MKHFMLTLLLSIAVASPYQTAYAQIRTVQKTQAQSELAQELAANDDEVCEDEEEHAVLDDFADMVTSFIHIVQDPNDPENVAENIGHMIADIGHILAHALKKSLDECGIPSHMHASIIRECQKELIASMTQKI